MGESIVTRIGRLIAGLAHDAVDGAERANPRTVLEQAIREIDSAADEARLALGRASAERQALEARARELDREGQGLTEKIALALRESREDLAEAGVGRQLDIEAQLAALSRAAREAQTRADELTGTLEAVRASRREAEQRLAALPTGAQAAGAATRLEAGERVARAEAAIARVAPGASPGSASIEELERLARKHAVQERLAAHKVNLLK
jgi:phage shock protein A